MKGQYKEAPALLERLTRCLGFRVGLPDDEAESPT